LPSETTVAPGIALGGAASVITILVAKARAKTVMITTENKIVVFLSIDFMLIKIRLVEQRSKRGLYFYKSPEHKPFG
jgi:hypothetical protein